MGTVLRIRKQKAFLREGFWRCADLDLESQLNTTTELWIQETGGPPIHSPDPEIDVARELARRFGGRVLAHVAAKGQAGAKRYFAQRQLRLF